MLNGLLLLEAEAPKLAVRAAFEWAALADKERSARSAGKPPYPPPAAAPAQAVLPVPCGRPVAGARKQ